MTRRKHKEVTGGGATNPQVFHSSNITAPRRYAGPHGIEKDVQRELLAEPRLHFSSLVIHRVQNGVCIEGVVEADDGSPDVTRLAKRVAGVDRVINRLVMTHARQLPPKG
jgi:osmotically-inducible protein OsmY